MRGRGEYLKAKSYRQGRQLQILGEVAELVEGAPLLREYGTKNSIEGSNPSLSDLSKSRIFLFLKIYFKTQYGFEPKKRVRLFLQERKNSPTSRK